MCWVLFVPSNAAIARSDLVRVSLWDRIQVLTEGYHRGQRPFFSAIMAHQEMIHLASTAIAGIFLLYLPFRFRELHNSHHRFPPGAPALIKLVG